jgi:hypothetical protein
MNGQLPPIDPGIREQLGRRSAGPAPETLLADVARALDATRTDEPRRRWLSRPGWRLPRLAVAGSAIALVAILVSATLVPAFHAAPAESPIGSSVPEALTQAQLATLLAGSPPAANAAFVASVTIDSRHDVCSMNRYPTVGVLEGMNPQVCVMGAGVAAYFNESRVSGTFAFRYLGPGVLGLLGEITPAPTQLAFRANGDWPFAGKTFLVEGWLGAVETTAICTALLVADPLAPYGEDCPYEDWLGANSTAPGIEADYGYNPNSPNPSYDPLSLRGNARHVEAGGMRVIDSVHANAPQYGTFVVRSVTEACPGDPPTSSRGCPAWRVMAKVSDDLVTGPASTPSATPAPTSTTAAWNPAERALSTAELGTVLASGEQQRYQILVVDAKVGSAPAGACPAADTLDVTASIAGVVAGLEPPACVYANVDTVPQAGLLVLRVLGKRQLGYMGSLTSASGRLAFKAAEDWPKGFLLVDAWLDFEVADCRKTSAPAWGGSDPLHPDYDFSCVASLSDSQPPAVVGPCASPSISPYPGLPPAVRDPGMCHAGPSDSPNPNPTYSVPADGKQVNALPSLVSPAPGLLSVPESVHGVFLVHYNPLCSLSDPTDCEQWQVIGQVDPLDLSPTPTP